MVMGVSSYIGKGRRRRRLFRSRATGNAIPGRRAKKRNRPRPFRAFFSWPAFGAWRVGVGNVAD